MHQCLGGKNSSDCLGHGVGRVNVWFRHRKQKVPEIEACEWMKQEGFLPACVLGSWGLWLRYVRSSCAYKSG